MDSYITWPYQIADHHCRITWVYNKTYYFMAKIHTELHKQDLKEICHKALFSFTYMPFFKYSNVFKNKLQITSLTKLIFH